MNVLDMFKLDGKVAVVTGGAGNYGKQMVRALAEAGATVYGYDLDQSITHFANLSGAIDGTLDDATIGKCQLIHIATYPDAAIDYMKDHAAQFPKDCIVMDDCGTKRKVCTAGFQLAKAHGYTYVGAHPMAGTKFSGFK